MRNILQVGARGIKAYQQDSKFVFLLHFFNEFTVTIHIVTVVVKITVVSINVEGIVICNCIFLTKLIPFKILAKHFEQLVSRNIYQKCWVRNLNWRKMNGKMCYSRGQAIGKTIIFIKSKQKFSIMKHFSTDTPFLINETFRLYIPFNLV